MTYVFQIDNSTNNDFYFAETALFYEMIIFSDKNEFPENYQSVGTRCDSAAAGKDNRHIVKKHSILEIKLRHPYTWVYKTTKEDNYKLLVRYFFSSKKKFQGALPLNGTFFINPADVFFE